MAPPVLLSTFFAAYPSFTHEPGSNPSKEFARLARSQGWGLPPRPGPAWKRHHRLFLSALESESHSHVHTYFIRNHSDFITYDPFETPKLEFERLAAQYQWKEDGATWTTQRNKFLEAYFDDFRGAMNDYFMNYEDEEMEARGLKGKGWVHNPWESPPTEWDRLAATMGWTRGEAEWKSERILFHEAVETDFNATFGETAEDTEGWKFLCYVLGIPTPELVDSDNAPHPQRAELFSTECKKSLAKAYVNIYDVLDAVRACGYIPFFQSEHDLGSYSYAERKVFPLHIAKGGALEFMLRSISKWRHKSERDEKRAKVQEQAKTEQLVGYELVKEDVTVVQDLVQNLQALQVNLVAK